MFLQKLHLNINYKKNNTNHVVDYLNRPTVIALNTMLKDYGDETSRWPKLYDNDPYFIITYQTLHVGKPIS